MTFNLEGTPLGLLDVQCWARDAASFGQKHETANSVPSKKRRARNG